MSINEVILLLGTNLNNKKKNLEDAKMQIELQIGAQIKESEITETEPVDFDSDNLFLNQLLTVKTSLSPVQLLDEIKVIEKQMGRKYLTTDQKYQDRIIDIDIIFYNDLTYKSSRLKIPHEQIKTRDFIKKMLNYYLIP